MAYCPLLPQDFLKGMAYCLLLPQNFFERNGLLSFAPSKYFLTKPVGGGDATKMYRSNKTQLN